MHRNQCVGSGRASYVPWCLGQRPTGSWPAAGPSRTWSGRTRPCASWATTRSPRRSPRPPRCPSPVAPQSGEHRVHGRAGTGHRRGMVLLFWSAQAHTVLWACAWPGGVTHAMAETHIHEHIHEHIHGRMVGKGWKPGLALCHLKSRTQTHWVARAGQQSKGLGSCPAFQTAKHKYAWEHGGDQHAIGGAHTQQSMPH